MIGSNILANPQLFNTAFNTLGADIAVHTWSHRYMTELSNLDAVAELGWTMEIIKNSTVSHASRYVCALLLITGRIFSGRSIAKVLETPIR